jgi:hypothetical protein
MFNRKPKIPKCWKKEGRLDKDKFINENKGFSVSVKQDGATASCVYSARIVDEQSNGDLKNSLKRCAKTKKEADKLAQSLMEEYNEC